MDFRSSHPICHKKSVIKSLWNRAESHCSNNELLKSEKSHLRSIFHANGYPNRIINKWTQKNQNVNDTNNDTTKWISVPYIKNISESAARILKKGGVSVAHKPSNTLRMNLMRVKDKRDVSDNAGVVYSIPCQDCDKKYVGETGRLLGTRIAEHKKDVEKKKE